MPAVRIDASDVIAVAASAMALGAKTEAAVVAGMNKAGDMGLTQVKAELRRQTGIPLGDMNRSKGLAKKLARKGDLEYEIIARARWTPLSYFGPSQAVAGVRASPWGQRRLFKRTFMATMRSGHVGVYVRVPGKSRREERVSASGRRYSTELGIRELWGPNLAEELVRDPVPSVFRVTTEANLPRLINHEVERALAGFGNPRKRK
jgi:hypothetical protein